MFRTTFMPSPNNSHRWKDSCAGLLAPLILWILVAVGLKYGSYGSRDLVLGPNSSRLITTSSIFVEQIQVRDQDRKGISVYGFSEKPELSLVTNWNFSRYLLIGSCRRQGYSFWLNKGSTIRIKWTAHISDLDDLSVAVVKGQKTYENGLPYVSNLIDSLVTKNLFTGNGESEYSVKEHDNYYIGILNMSPRNIVMIMDVNVSSTMYDISNSMSKCSTINGYCQLKLLFPNPKFTVLSTPNNDDINGWSVEFSFVARLVTYVVILGLLVILIALIMKYLMPYETETDTEEVRARSETAPLMPAPEKALSFSYGTGEEDPELGMCESTSEDLYDGKICVICYDEPRNSFFVPCGHCATCHVCAQRILDGENKVCPICRRFIHKIRKIG